MQVRVHDTTPVVPLQAGELHRTDGRDGAQVSVYANVPLAMLTERDLSGVARLRSLDHPQAIVAVTDRVAQLKIIPPQLELARRSITRGRQWSLAVVDGRPLMREATEPLVDDRGDVPVEQLRADRRALAAADLQAGVRHEPVRIDRPLQHVPAGGTTGDPGEQPIMVASVVVADAANRVGGVPQLLCDDRLPRVLDVTAARAAEVTERRDRLHDPDDRAVRPRATARARDTVGYEITGDLAPADAAGPLGEDAMHDRGGHRVDNDLPVAVAAVAVRGADGVPAGGVRAVHRGSDLLVGLVALPLGHDEQQPEHRPAHRGSRVDALGDRHDSGAALVQLVDRRQSADDGAGEPVEPRDDDPLGDAVLDSLERGTHPRSFHRAAGPVEVLVHLRDPDAVSLRPAADRVALRGRRLEAVARAAGHLGHADVAVHDGRSGHARCIVHGGGCSRGSDRGHDMGRASA